MHCVYWHDTCIVLRSRSVVVYGQVLHFDVNEERLITVLFDAAHKDDFHSCTVDDELTVTYCEHPHVVSLLYDPYKILW